MGKMLKYLFPLIAALALWNCADEPASSVNEEAAAVSFSEPVCHANISASESQLCLPRQVSFASPQTLQGTARRTNSVHRNNLEFAKSGRILNAGLICFVQRKSLIIHSSLLEPSNKLLCLGQLII